LNSSQIARQDRCAEQHFNKVHS